MLVKLLEFSNFEYDIIPSRNYYIRRRGELQCLYYSALHQLKVAVDTSIQMLDQYTEIDLKIAPIQSKRSLFEMYATSFSYLPC